MTPAERHDANLATLAGLREQLAKASPLPWRLERTDPNPQISAGEMGYGDVIEMATVECMAYCYGGSSRVEISDADLALIVSAVNSRQAVLDDIERRLGIHELLLGQPDGPVCLPEGVPWPCLEYEAAEELLHALAGDQ